MPKLTIDGIKIEVEPGTSILQAAESLGIEIPRFCYHDKLSIPANCRMCLVEVSPGPPKPQASCALACTDDMEVKTDSEMVREARKGVMELQLINHPLDCPVCDQGGECDLQDQAVAYGFDRSRYHESKKAMPDKELGPLIKTVMTRCINCTRCVRFGEEIAGTPYLGQFHRGEDAEIGTFVEKMMDSELSGNLIDVCPVGALTSRPYAFRARPWELKNTDTVDVHDAVGSNIRIATSGREVMRILPRLHEDINEHWINDRSRFSYDGLKYNRLDKPYLRDDKTKKLRSASWNEVLSAVGEKLKKTKPDNIAALAGELCDIGSMVALKDLMSDLGVKNIECRLNGENYDVSDRCGYLFNSGIAGIEEADAILLIGTNPKWEATIINARIRKSWLENNVPIAVVGEERDLTYPYSYIGAGPDSLENILTGKHEFCKILKSAKKPMLILGEGALRRKDGAAIQGKAREIAEEFDMVGKDWNGFNMLHNAASRVGALDIGFTSPKGFELESMDLVYILGADGDYIDNISDKAFVIYQGHHGDKGAERADVILPGAAYTEKNGLYVNTEGRPQIARRAAYAPSEAREDWKILRAISEHTGRILPYNDDIDLFERLVNEWPHLGKMDVISEVKWKKFGNKNKVKSELFKPLHKDFYITNVITKSSKVMQECREEFSIDSNKEQHMEAAE
jgi:NADH-quinone oxidoreductase subunit G